MEELRIARLSEARWDAVALGEVMLRLDPGESHVETTRRFDVWEGGGEYNVTRSLHSCFGLRSCIVTALVDNPVGRLIEGLIRQGGVDTSRILWRKFDGVGRAARNGLNFTERGFGVRGAVGVSDRGHTAVSLLKPGEFDWEDLFGSERVRWFHCGGIFAALGDHTPDVIAEAMSAACRHGAVVSYDLNYRASLWNEFGGEERAREVNRKLVDMVDVLFGNGEDFTAALGFEMGDAPTEPSELDLLRYWQVMERVATEFPRLSAVASSLRVARSASRNDWGAACLYQGELLEAPWRRDLEILDRVGGGDSFASGLIYGLLSGFDMPKALNYGAAHGALAMTTPGDSSMATLQEVSDLVAGGSARVQR